MEVPMYLHDILRVHAYSARRPSYEVRSPEPGSDEKLLLREISKTIPYEPRFVSIATTEPFPDHLENIRFAGIIERSFCIPTVVHLPFGELSREKALRITEALARNDLKNVMIVRGPEQSQNLGAPVFPHASDAITWMRRELPDLSISAACYPDKHPDARTDDEDRVHTERRVACGARTFFTQISADPLASYRNRVVRDPAYELIQTPIVPLIPLFDKQGFVIKLLGASGAPLPLHMRHNLIRCPSWEREGRWTAHVEFVARQLLELDVHSLHFVTFNAFPMFHRVWQNLLHRWEGPSDSDYKRAYLNP